MAPNADLLRKHILPTGGTLAMTSDFIWTIRVYYEDTDAGGIVFYANYLKFFERARTEWLRAAGISQQALAESGRVMFVVKQTAVDYHAPAKLDDELKLTVVVERLGRASVQFVQQAWRGSAEQQLLASGRIKVGCVDTGSLRPAPIPDSVLDRIKSTTSMSRSEMPLRPTPALPGI